jgi:hypothetical protein
MDVSTTKICLDTSTLAKNIMGQREYIHYLSLVFSIPMFFFLKLDFPMFLNSYNTERRLN